ADTAEALPPAEAAADIERTITVRGRSLRVAERRGVAGRTPLVLCNGIGSSMELFDPFLAELDPERPVVRFDVPGVGASPRPVLPYRLPSLAFTLRAVLDRLGHHQVDILGISWGGGLAQQFAFQHPRRCRHLVLVATGTGSLMVPAGPAVLARMLTPRRHRDPDYALRIAGEIYGGSARSAPAEAIEALHGIGHPTTRRGYVYQLLASAGWASLPFLPLIRTPTLLLAGSDDPIIPEINATLMARLLPKATLHRYAGGHLGLLTEAGDLAPVIENFLDTAPAPEPAAPRENGAQR
ncbi:MAG: poly(3-hydroxyalkanoate) depolymerase, partial [Sciscionella sp.]